MKDIEFGEGGRLTSFPHDAKRAALKKKITLALCMILMAAGIGIFVFHGDRPIRTADEFMRAEQVVSRAAHELAARGECNETAVAWAESSVEGLVTNAPGPTGRPSVSQFLTDTSSYTMSAEATTTVQTETTAAQSTSTTASTSTSTITQTATITLTTGPAAYAFSYPYMYTEQTEASSSTSTSKPLHTCESGTQTVLVTVYPVPDVTVTAGASTVTNVNTNVSLTTGLPDITLSGSPSTVTAVQTDVSFRTGPQDATVSGSPSTATEVQTDISVTNPPPDATVSGGPSTVTETVVSFSPTDTDTVVTVTQFSSSSVSTSTKTVTVTSGSTPFTTITISDLFSPPGASSSAEGEVVTESTSKHRVTHTYTQIVTATDGPPEVQSSTMEVPPPSYTSYNESSTANPAVTPVVVSKGGKKPEPNGWASTKNGSGGMACSVMLVATIMALL